MPNNLAASIVLNMINHAETHSSPTPVAKPLPPANLDDRESGRKLTGAMVKRMIEHAERNR